MGSVYSSAKSIVSEKKHIPGEMIVKIFTITPQRSTDINDFDSNLHNLFTECGGNVPQFSQYDGGDRITYLICLDDDIDVDILCKKHKIHISSDIYLMTVKKNQYNSGHAISPTYSSNSERYRIEKVDDIIRIYDHKRKQYMPFCINRNYTYIEKDNTFIKNDDPSVVIKCS